MSVEKKKKIVLTCELPEQLKAELDAIVAQGEVSMATHVRAALRDYIDAYNFSREEQVFALASETRSEPAEKAVEAAVALQPVPQAPTPPQPVQATQQAPQPQQQGRWVRDPWANMWNGN